MLFISSQTIRPRKGPLYFITGVLIAFVFALSGRPQAADVTAWLAGAGLLLFIWFYYALSKTKIIVDNNGIAFEYLFKKQATVAWTDIISSRIVSHYHGHGATIEWEFVSASGKNTLSPSFYSRKNLRLLAESLTGKCPYASIDKRIIKIAEGRFPWYIF